jgi:filamentous hemagglutinin
VDLVAGGDVTITGSEVLSKTGTGIIGRNVTIQAAEDTLKVKETQTFKQSGLNVSLRGGAVDTALAVKGSVQRAGEVKDGRLAVLHGAQAGQRLFSDNQAGINSLTGVGGQMNQAVADVRDRTRTEGGMSLRIGIGSSANSSEMDYTATTARGSRIASDGDVVIRATGDGQGNGGDVRITGSRVEGENVTLDAARDLLLQSQRETSE